MPAEPHRCGRLGRGGERGFALVEMLVAMAILSLVGLTLARFQTLQLGGTQQTNLVAGARLLADNLAVDAMVAPALRGIPRAGTATALGADWRWTIEIAPYAGPGIEPGLYQVAIAVSGHGVTPVRRAFLRPLALGGDRDDNEGASKGTKGGGA